MTITPLSLRGHNPDVLSCIANLSNDEVFTPPEFANQMLDTLAAAWSQANGGANIWADPTVTFLDPFAKSGVFLREITRRLTTGLEDKIPDLTERVDHILTRQVFGIGITQLTALLARRSVYCSKSANGPHSIAKSFTTDSGNIWFERTEHTWGGGKREFRVDPLTSEEVAVFTNRKCIYCGAREDAYARGDDSESHAYAFIHTDDISARLAELFGDNMQFDVIIGNPPYHLSDGGGTGSSASNIYNLFVDQAKKLDPRFLTMIVPSRWFTGGKGLDDFRREMLSDGRVRSLTDYPISADVFPSNGPKGGVCTFLWSRDDPGLCNVTTRFKGVDSTSERPLLEPGVNVFVRFNEGLSVLRKLASVECPNSRSLALPTNRRFRDLVSVRGPFGFSSKFRGRNTPREGDLRIRQKGGIGYVSRDEVTAGNELVDSWKIFVGFAAPGTGNKDTYPHRIISTPFIGEPGEISTETYLCIGPFGTESEAKSALSYLTCRIVRFLILLHKPSQNTTRNVYTFVPTQDWTVRWTDDLLRKRYGIDDQEMAFIEKVVRPMEIDVDG